MSGKGSEFRRPVVAHDLPVGGRAFDVEARLTRERRLPSDLQSSPSITFAQKVSFVRRPAENELSSKAISQPR